MASDPSTLTRRARSRTGLTQLEFARIIGANRATVAAWEAGLREPSRLTLSLLCLIAEFGQEAADQLKKCHRALDRAAGITSSSA
jgi:DNA-binding transcriptional regulator YiaG